MFDQNTHDRVISRHQFYLSFTKNKNNKASPWQVQVGNITGAIQQVDTKVAQMMGPSAAIVGTQKVCMYTLSLVVWGMELTSIEEKRTEKTRWREDI